MKGATLTIRGGFSIVMYFSTFDFNNLTANREYNANYEAKLVFAEAHLSGIGMEILRAPKNLIYGTRRSNPKG